MRLSTKSRYGLRILMQIAIDNHEGNAAQGKSISKKQEISEPYLEQIMIPLKNTGLVRTTRGCNGGYFLNKAPKDITILDVIELFEGKLNLVDCVAKRENCEREGQCVTREVWMALTDAMRDTLRNFTVAQLCDLHRKQQNTQDYSI